MIVSRNPRTPRLAFEGIMDDGVDQVHGFFDGTWSLIDGIREMLRLAGPSRVTLSTWTAADADLRDAERMLRARLIVDFRLCVDRSFITRQPKYCATARALFGDGAIRVWNSHAKFCVVQGDGADLLLLSSANLNRNRRVENFSLFRSAEMIETYLGLVNVLFEIQGAGVGIDNPANGRPDTDEAVRRVS